MGDINYLTQIKFIGALLIVSIFLSSIVLSNLTFDAGNHLDNIIDSNNENGYYLDIDKNMNSIIRTSNPGELESDVNGGTRAVTRNTNTINWTMLHGNLQNHGFSNAIVPKISSTIWSVQLKDQNEEPVKLYSSPIVAGDQVFVCTEDHKIYSFDRLNGSENWNISTDGLAINPSGPIESTPAVVNDRLYVGCEDSYLYCFNALNGDLIWYNKTNGAIKSSPKVVNNSVIIACYDNGPLRAKVYSFNATNGDLNWNFSAPSDSDFYSSPAIDTATERLFIGLRPGNPGTGNPTVYSLFLSNGSVNWTYTTNNGVYSSMSLAGDKVLFGDLDGFVYALNKDTGKQIWNTSTGGQIQSSPAVDFAKGVMYIGSDDGNLYAVKLSDGTKVWLYTAQEGSARFEIRTPPVIANDRILFGANRYIYCLSNDLSITPGLRLLWRYAHPDSNDSVFSSVAVSEGFAFSTSEEGWLTAFADPDLAADAPELVASEAYSYVGETIEISGKVKNDGSMKLSGTCNFYFFVLLNQGTPDKRLISSHDFTLDVNERMTINTSAVIFERDWSNVDQTMIWLEIDNVSYPEKPDKQDNNLAVEWITVLENYKAGWMSYQRDNVNSGYGASGSLTNKTIWKYDLNLGTNSLKSSPLHAKGRLFIGSTGGDLYRILDIDDEPKLDPPTYNTGSGIIGSPALLMNKGGGLDFEKIFFGTEDGRVFALTTNEGELNWTYETGSSIQGAPLVSDGIVYIGTMSGDFYAIDEDGFYDGDQGVDDTDESAGKGDLLWSISLPGPTKSVPALMNDLIILVTTDASDSTILAMDRETRNINWSYKFSTPLNGSPIIDNENGYVYVSGSDQFMYAFDIYGLFNGNQEWTGENAGVNVNADIIWRYPVGAYIPSTGALDTANQYLIFGTSKGDVYALESSTGDLIWKYSTGEPIIAPPTIANGKVYVSTDNGILYCLAEFNNNASSLKTDLLWQFNAKDRIIGSPIVNSFATYFATEKGIIYKLGAPNEKPFAIIDSPVFNHIYFIDDKITLDATSSYDLEDGSNLKYIWRFSPKAEPTNIKILFNTTIDPIVSIPLNDTIKLPGEYTINLTVIDSFGAEAYNTTNITVTAPVIKLWPNETIPAWCKIYFSDNGAIDLYKTVDPGVGYLDGEGNSIGNIGLFVDQYYLVYEANYKVGWFNISIGYRYFPHPDGYNISRARMFRLENNNWIKCVNTGIVEESELVWANITGDIIKPFINQLFAPGTFDNRPPVLTVREDIVKPVDGSKDQNFTFIVEYTDQEGEFPIAKNGGYISIVINDETYPMKMTNIDDTSVIDGKFYTLTLNGTEFLPGSNQFQIFAHDGTYLVKSDVFVGPNVTFGANPIANAGVDKTVEVGEVFWLYGNESFDPDIDGNIKIWLWDTDGDGDFNDSGGSAVGETTTWKFDTPGIKNVVLWVRDNDKLIDTDTVTITVTPKGDKDDGKAEGLSAQDLMLYGGIVGLIILILLIIVLLLYRNKLQAERDRKTFIKKEAEDEEDEGEEEDEDEGEDDEDEDEEEEEDEGEDEDVDEEGEDEDKDEEEDLDAELEKELEEELDEEEQEDIGLEEEISEDELEEEFEEDFEEEPISEGEGEEISEDEELKAESKETTVKESKKKSIKKVKKPIEPTKKHKLKESRSAETLKRPKKIKRIKKK